MFEQITKSLQKLIFFHPALPHLDCVVISLRVSPPKGKRALFLDEKDLCDIGLNKLMEDLTR